MNVIIVRRGDIIKQIIHGSWFIPNTTEYENMNFCLKH